MTDTDPVCCDVPENKRNAECWPIEIPNTDPFYALFRRRCMEFVRSASSIRPECKLGPRTQLNLISSVLDANWVYGSDKETADKLRSFRYGLLKATPVFKEYGLKDLLPLKMDNPDDGCIRATPDTYCFMAGWFFGLPLLSLLTFCHYKRLTMEQVILVSTNNWSCP